MEGKEKLLNINIEAEKSVGAEMQLRKREISLVHRIFISIMNDHLLQTSLKHIKV